MTILLKGNYVEMPRKWNPKTAIALCVASALQYPPLFETEPKYLRADQVEESILTKHMTKSIIICLEKQMHSTWQRMVG